MRELSLEEFVDEIYEDFKRNEDTAYVFFLGAGCSKSSGIPLAKELAQGWYEELKKQNSKFNRFNTENEIDIEEDIDYARYYFKIFESLFSTPLAQQKEIQSITEGKIPSLGYYMLSALMQKPQFNTVVTTNFDNLIQDALIYSGDKRALVITHQDLSKFIDRNNTPLITKIHGDAHMHPFNNEGSTQEIPEELKTAIQGLFINAKVICIGYSGNDKSIANLLDGCNRIDQVYWLNSTEPADVAVKDWWSKLANKTFIKEYDFDKIMNLIKSKFNLLKPDFNKRAKELQNSYEKALEEEIEEIEAIENKTIYDYITLGCAYGEEKNYYKAIEAYKKAIQLNPENHGLHANIACAYEEINDYDNAQKHYLKALKLEPNAADFNGNYASFLLTKSKKNEAAIYLDNAFKFSNDKNLDTELYFYKLAHFKDEYDGAKEKLDELLKDGYKSKNWNLSQNIKQAIKDKHEHVDELKEYAKKISGIDYSDID